MSPADPGGEPLAAQVAAAVAPFEAEVPRGGTVRGTACFFSFSAGERGRIPVLLGTRRLLGEAVSARFSFAAGEVVAGALRPAGGRFELKVARVAPLVLGHPDPEVDLVALPLRSLEAAARRGGQAIYRVPFEEGFLGTPGVVEGLHRHEAVRVVGFPVGPRGEVPPTPSLREGATGIHPNEDYQGRLVGVVDTPCVPGAAGSAVVILDEDGYRRGSEDVEGSRLVFLGVLSGRPVTGAAPGDGPDPAHYVKARAVVELGREIRERLGLR